MIVFFQTLAKAVALGSIYAIMGLSFVLIFKGTQVLNFATGAISMAGALFFSILVADRGLPFLPWSNPLGAEADADYTMSRWLVNLAIALVLAAIFGMVLERIAIRPMVGQPLFAMAVITLGLEIAIRPFNLDATALTGRSIEVPWGNEVWDIGGVIVPKSYLAAVIAGAIAFGFVFWFYRSRLGVAMRAVAFDQEAAMAQGINVGRVFSIAWAIGAALAVLAAIVFAMAPWPPGGVVSQEIHPIWIFRVLPVIVLGGLDSVVGAVYGGLMIAFFEIFAGQYLSQWTNILGPGYSTIVPYLVMLIVLIVRPYGLFGTPEIRRV
ncbi:MAG: branched-chain amino acid ABC transporter permease [Actinomycetota bacterium]